MQINSLNPMLILAVQCILPVRKGGEKTQPWLQAKQVSPLERQLTTGLHGAFITKSIVVSSDLPCSSLPYAAFTVYKNVCGSGCWTHIGKMSRSCVNRDA